MSNHELCWLGGHTDPLDQIAIRSSAYHNISSTDAMTVSRLTKFWAVCL